MEKELKIAIFKGKKIRKIIYQNEWWFSVVDVVEALVDTDRPSAYWTAMKVRIKNEDGFEPSTICRGKPVCDNPHFKMLHTAILRLTSG